MAQTLAGCISCPLADRGQRPGAGQHPQTATANPRLAHADGYGSPSRIGELGEVGEQAAELVAGQRGGRDRMGGAGRG